MRVSYASVVASALVLLTAAVALWAWIALPTGAGVPIDALGLDGVRHVGSSRVVLWLIPLVSLTVTIGFALAARRGALEAAAQPFEATLLAVLGLLLITEYALAGRAFNHAFNVMQPVALATGALLFVVGNYLGKARRNAVFGLRTPWTLADASVWDKTHRFTGRAMVLAGLVLFVVALFVTEATALGLAIGACAAIPLIAGAAWSARLARQGPDPA